MYKQIHHTQHLMAAILSPGVHKDFHFLRRICLKDVYENWDNLKYKTPRKAKQQLKELLPKYVWIHQRGWSRGGPIYLHTHSVAHDARVQHVHHKHTYLDDLGICYPEPYQVVVEQRVQQGEHHQMNHQGTSNVRLPLPGGLRLRRNFTSQSFQPIDRVLLLPS